MWIREFEVKNVGPFEHRKFELTRGSIGIFGRNGSGKSTLMNLLFAALTGDYSRFDGVKVDCVRNTAGPKDEAFLRVVVEHNQRVLTVRRKLRGSPNTELVVDDEKPITDHNKAQARIYEILGVDQRLLDLYVFKTQDRIYDFISTTPAVRAAAYQTLCRTEGCERGWAILGEYLTKDTEAIVDIVDNSDELSQAIQVAKAALEDLDGRITEETLKLLNAKSKASAEEIVQSYNRYTVLLEQIGSYKDKVASAKAHWTESQEAAEPSEATAIKAEAKAEKLKVPAETARAALKAMKNFRAHRQRAKQLLEEKAALAAEKKQTEEVAEPSGDVSKKQAKLAKLRADLETARTHVGRFDKSECPTCGTPLQNMPKDLRETLDAARKAVKDLPSEIKTLQADIAEDEAAAAAYAKYSRWKAAITAKIEANASAIEAHGDMESPDGDEEELNLTITGEAAAVEAAQQARAKARTSATKVQQAESHYNAVKKQLDDMKASRDESKQDEDVVKRAKDRLHEHARAAQQIAGWEGEAKGYRREVQTKTEELTVLRTKLERSKRVRGMTKIINRARDVLHRDCLPRMVAQVNLSRMQHDINDGLQHFGNPYWVEANEDLSFTAHKPGEPPQPAARLSTGQRVVLAIPFWFAVASLWGEDLGILALDEPTANLDGDNRKFLSEALKTLSAQVRGRRQILMVTHDPDLRSSFDSVIDV